MSEDETDADVEMMKSGEVFLNAWAEARHMASELAIESRMLAMGF